ncbi:MAG: metallophosphoesterase [Spartobacteria bacterium]
MKGLLRRTIEFVPRWLRWVLLAAGALVFLLLIWGVAIEPRLIDCREETALVPNLPRSWEGKRVALIADFQVGMWLGNEETVTRIVTRIVRERPAAVLFAGDFVYKPTDEDEPGEIEREDTHDFMTEVNRSVALLHPLSVAGIPVYAVLGNHDYGMNHPSSVKNKQIAAALRQALGKAGVRLLENTSLPLPTFLESDSQPRHPGNEPNLYLVGLGSRYAGNAKPEAALASLPKDSPRIVLMHNPDSFPEFPAQTAALALAGHTHGGQIRIPFTESWSWMALISEEKVHADGWIHGFGQTGNRLYINRGIGFSSFPVRINCRPELTLFTLRRENR